MTRAPIRSGRYRWDELGRLTEVAVDDDGHDARAIDAVVNAPGELASVEDTPLLWDSAHPLSPLAWNGEASILREVGRERSAATSSRR